MRILTALFALVFSLAPSAQTVVIVHPGPAFFPSGDPEFSRENDDYRRLEQAIKVLLDEHDSIPRPETRPT